MSRLRRKILAILDGTPSEYGKATQGQSIIEMAFIMPLLVVLITGIIEIGWIANNYLSLQEVAKVGARRGTVLSGDNNPISWENNDILTELTILPASSTGGTSIDGTTDGAVNTAREDARNCQLGLSTNNAGFYNLILCQMIDSLSPLEMNSENGIDDIAISVFAVQTMFNDPGGDVDFENGYGPGLDVDEYEPGYIPVVVGRYPTNANECNVLETGARNNSIERDPFNYIDDRDGGTGNVILTYDSSTAQATNPPYTDQPIELADEVNGVWVPRGHDNNNEQQRGFAYLGQHRIEAITVELANGSRTTYDVDCYGSEWSIYDVQERMAVPTFEFDASDITCIEGECVDPNEDLGVYLPSQGLVLVEIWWQHQLLLNLPIFSPVMNALGDDQTTIYVWSAFPVPAVEPRIQYEN